MLKVRLEPVNGDPDLYLWAPDHATRPPWVSNLAEGVDDVQITAPVAGRYQVEVFGYSAAEYRLIVDVNAATGAEVHGGIAPNKQTLFTQPAVPADAAPPSNIGIDSPGQRQQPLFLPLVQR